PLHVTINLIGKDGGPINIAFATPPAPPPVATVTKAVLSIKGGDMAGTITVDTTNEVVNLSYEDDKGDPTAAPAGASVVFASDNPAVLTVGTPTATATGFTAPLTPVAPGSYNLSATQSGAVEADGTTPIPDPAPFAGTVVAGPASQAVLAESP
ncbi:MAG: hypothetical protein ACRDZY_11705, partial [Acidimicrobiales bacterium]